MGVDKNLWIWVGHIGIDGGQRRVSRSSKYSYFYSNSFNFGGHYNTGQRQFRWRRRGEFISNTTPEAQQHRHAASL